MTKEEKSSYIRKQHTRIVRCCLACLIILLASGLLVVTRRTLHVFGQISFDQILFHMSIPRDAVSPEVTNEITDYWGILRDVLIYSSGFCLISISLCFYAVRKHCRRLFLYLGERPMLVMLIFAVLCFIFSLLYFNSKFKISQSIIAICHKSSLINDSYINCEISEFRQLNADGKLMSLSEKPNLVIISSESLEATYAHQEIFGKNLIYELTNLREEGNHVDNLLQVNGSHYTIGAWYSMLYGLPLLYFHCNINGTPIHKNLFSKKCICFPDVLHANGYSINMLIGASLKFGGKNTLFNHIPGACSVGLDEFAPNEISELRTWGHRGNQGVWDKDLFQKARNTMLQLANDKRPFLLLLETLDPHTGNNPQPGTPREFNDERDIIRLQSNLIMDFIEWIQMQPFGENTVIVVLGDHYLMSEKLGAIPMPEENRQIFNCIINSKANCQMKQHIAAAFDMAPTILQAVGFKWNSNGLGIGKSLYADDPTILDKISIETWNEESRKFSPKYFELINQLK